MKYQFLRAPTIIPSWMRTCALIVAICLSMTSIAEAASLIAPTSSSEHPSWVAPDPVPPADGARTTVLPDALGWISDAYDPDIPSASGVVKTPFIRLLRTQPTIIHIQDLHTDPTAQFKLAELLAFLHRTLGIRLVAVEGAAGRCNTELFSSFPDQEMNRKIAALFVKEGLFTGSEFQAITEPGSITLQGVEDAPAYLDHLATYQRTAPQRPQLDAALQRLKTALEVLVAKLYPASVKELAQYRAAYEAQRVGLRAHLEALDRLMRRSHVQLDTPPTLTQFKTLASLESSLDGHTVEKEHIQLLHQLSTLLEASQLDSLLTQSLAYRDRQLPADAYFSALRRVAEEAGVTLDAFPHLSTYMRVVMLRHDVDLRQLNLELERFHTAIQNTLLVKPEQRQLAQLVEMANWLELLIHTRFTHDEFLTYTAQHHTRNREAFGQLLARHHRLLAKSRISVSALDQDLATLFNSTSGYERFYQLAQNRDDALVDHTLELLRHEQQGAVVLIAGGFHTPHVTQLLKDRGVRYLVVTPRVEQSPDEQLYADRLLNRMPKLATLWTKLNTATLTPPYASDTIDPQRHYAAVGDFGALQAANRLATGWSTERVAEIFAAAPPLRTGYTVVSNPDGVEINNYATVTSTPNATSPITIRVRGDETPSAPEVIVPEAEQATKSLDGSRAASHPRIQHSVITKILAILRSVAGRLGCGPSEPDPTRRRLVRIGSGVLLTGAAVTALPGCGILFASSRLKEQTEWKSPQSEPRTELPARLDFRDVRTLGLKNNIDLILRGFDAVIQQAKADAVLKPQVTFFGTVGQGDGQTIYEGGAEIYHPLFGTLRITSGDPTKLMVEVGAALNKLVGGLGIADEALANQLVEIGKRKIRAAADQLYRERWARDLTEIHALQRKQRLLEQPENRQPIGLGQLAQTPQVVETEGIAGQWARMPHALQGEIAQVSTRLIHEIGPRSTSLQQVVNATITPPSPEELLRLPPIEEMVTRATTIQSAGDTSYHTTLLLAPYNSQLAVALAEWQAKVIEFEREKLLHDTPLAVVGAAFTKLASGFTSEFTQVPGVVLPDNDTAQWSAQLGLAWTFGEGHEARLKIAQAELKQATENVLNAIRTVDAQVTQVVTEIETTSRDIATLTGNTALLEQVLAKSQRGTSSTHPWVKGRPLVSQDRLIKPRNVTRDQEFALTDAQVKLAWLQEQLRVLGALPDDFWPQMDAQISRVTPGGVLATPTLVNAAKSTAPPTTPDSRLEQIRALRDRLSALLGQSAIPDLTTFSEEDVRRLTLGKQWNVVGRIRIAQVIRTIDQRIEQLDPSSSQPDMTALLAGVSQPLREAMNAFGRASEEEASKQVQELLEEAVRLSIPLSQDHVAPKPWVIRTLLPLILFFSSIFFAPTVLPGAAQAAIAAFPTGPPTVHRFVEGQNPWNVMRKQGFKGSDILKLAEQLSERTWRNRAGRLMTLVFPGETLRTDASTKRITLITRTGEQLEASLSDTAPRAPTAAKRPAATKTQRAAPTKTPLIEEPSSTPTHVETVLPELTPTETQEPIPPPTETPEPAATSTWHPDPTATFKQPVPPRPTHRPAAPPPPTAAPVPVGDATPIIPMSASSPSHDDRHDPLILQGKIGPLHALWSTGATLNPVVKAERAALKNKQAILMSTLHSLLILKDNQGEPIIGQDRLFELWPHVVDVATALVPVERRALLDQKRLQVVSIVRKMPLDKAPTTPRDVTVRLTDSMGKTVTSTIRRITRADDVVNKTALLTIEVELGAPLKDPYTPLDYTVTVSSTPRRDNQRQGAHISVHPNAVYREVLSLEDGQLSVWSQRSMRPDANHTLFSFDPTELGKQVAKTWTEFVQESGAYLRQGGPDKNRPGVIDEVQGALLKVKQRGLEPINAQLDQFKKKIGNVVPLVVVQGEKEAMLTPRTVIGAVGRASSEEAMLVPHDWPISYGDAVTVTMFDGRRLPGRVIEIKPYENTDDAVVSSAHAQAIVIEVSDPFHGLPVDIELNPTDQHVDNRPQSADRALPLFEAIPTDSPSLLMNRAYDMNPVRPYDALVNLIETEIHPAHRLKLMDDLAERLGTPEAVETLKHLIRSDTPERGLAPAALRLLRRNSDTLPYLAEMIDLLDEAMRAGQDDLSNLIADTIGDTLEERAAQGQWPELADLLRGMGADPHHPTFNRTINRVFLSLLVSRDPHAPGIPTIVRGYWRNTELEAWSRRIRGSHPELASLLENELARRTRLLIIRHPEQGRKARAVSGSFLSNKVQDPLDAADRFHQYCVWDEGLLLNSPRWSDFGSSMYNNGFAPTTSSNAPAPFNMPDITPSDISYLPDTASAYPDDDFERRSPQNQLQLVSRAPLDQLTRWLRLPGLPTDTQNSIIDRLSHVPEPKGGVFLGGSFLARAYVETHDSAMKSRCAQALWSVLPLAAGQADQPITSSPHPPLNGVGRVAAMQRYEQALQELSRQVDSDEERLYIFRYFVSFVASPFELSSHFMFDTTRPADQLAVWTSTFHLEHQDAAAQGLERIVNEELVRRAGRHAAVLAAENWLAFQLGTWNPAVTNTPEGKEVADVLEQTEPKNWVHDPRPSLQADLRDHGNDATRSANTQEIAKWMAGEMEVVLREFTTPRHHASRLSPEQEHERVAWLSWFGLGGILSTTAVQRRRSRRGMLAQLRSPLLRITGPARRRVLNARLNREFRRSLSREKTNEDLRRLKIEAAYLSKYAGFQHTAVRLSRGANVLLENLAHQQPLSQQELRSILGSLDKIVRDPSIRLSTAWIPPDENRLKRLVTVYRLVADLANLTMRTMAVQPLPMSQFEQFRLMRFNQECEHYTSLLAPIRRAIAPIQNIASLADYNIQREDVTHYWWIVDVRRAWWEVKNMFKRPTYRRILKWLNYSKTMEHAYRVLPDRIEAAATHINRVAPLLSSDSRRLGDEMTTDLKTYVGELYDQVIRKEDRTGVPGLWDTTQLMRRLWPWITFALIPAFPTLFSLWLWLQSSKFYFEPLFLIPSLVVGSLILIAGSWIGHWRPLAKSLKDPFAVYEPILFERVAQHNHDRIHQSLKQEGISDDDVKDLEQEEIPALEEREKWAAYDREHDTHPDGSYVNLPHAHIVCVLAGPDLSYAQYLHQALKGWIRTDVVLDIHTTHHPIKGSLWDVAEARHDLKTRYSEYRKDYPQLPAEFQDARILFYFAGGQARDVLPLAQGSNALIPLPVEHHGRQVCTLHDALARGSRYFEPDAASSQRALKEAFLVTDGWFTSVDPGPLEHLDGMVLLTTKKSLEHVQEEDAGMSFDEENGPKANRVIDFFEKTRNDSPGDVIGTYTELAGRIDFQNPNTPQVDSFTGDALAAFNEPGAYNLYDNYLESVYALGLQSLQRPSHEISIPSLDFTHALIVAMVKLAKGGNPPIRVFEIPLLHQEARHADLTRYPVWLRETVGESAILPDSLRNHPFKLHSIVSIHDPGDEADRRVHGVELAIRREGIPQQVSLFFEPEDMLVDPINGGRKGVRRLRTYAAGIRTRGLPLDSPKFRGAMEYYANLEARYGATQPKKDAMTPHWLGLPEADVLKRFIVRRNGAWVPFFAENATLWTAPLWPLGDVDPAEMREWVATLRSGGSLQINDEAEFLRTHISLQETASVLDYERLTHDLAGSYALPASPHFPENGRGNTEPVDPHILAPEGSPIAGAVTSLRTEASSN